MLPSKRIYQRVRTPDQLELQEKEKISVKVKTLDNRIIELEQKRNDLILDLKVVLEKKLRVRKEKQKIIFHGRVLDDMKKLSECGIENGSVIHLIAKCDRFVENLQNVEIDEESMGYTLFREILFHRFLEFTINIFL